MVFVNRGNSLGGLPAALRAMSNVRAWARRPKRLHFHLLADEQQHGAVSAMTTLGAQAAGVVAAGGICWIICGDV